MSEKRFVLCKKGDGEYIEDNGCVQLYGFDVLCEMLNEQQPTIDKLKEENEQLKQELAELLAVHTKIVETLDSEFVSKALEDGD